jgi:hypothetical protein
MTSMVPALRTRVPYRHDRLVDSGEPLPVLSVRLHSQVSVRPARLVFQEHPRPRTGEMVRWIHDRDPLRAEGERRPPHFPFAYRGYVAAHPEGEQEVIVRLWEEPSGRPLEARLPRDWFHEGAPYKGMAFRLVTWMVEDDAGTIAPRSRIERLGRESTREEAQP